MSDTTRDRLGSPPSDGPLVWADRVGEFPAPVGAPVADGPPPEPPRKKSKKHLIGYPATALIALIIGSSGSNEPPAPLAAPVPQTVTATVVDTVTETVTTPGPTMTETITVTAPAPKPAVTATSRATAPAPLKAPAPKPAAPSPKPASVYYANCDAARAAGVTPLYLGEPGYRAGLDRDSDGVACEN